jgi:hypothetical protein
VRLDHLLSREYQVEVLGVISALLAPRLIVAIDTTSSSGGRGADPRIREVAGDLAKCTDTALFGSEFLSLFKG